MAEVTVHQAIAAAALAVGAVGKGGKMEAGPARYKYRTLDDLMNAVHEPLCENGVTFVPSNVQMLDTIEKTTKSGSIQYHLRALVTYAIYGPAGDCVYATVIAEGTDTGDKAGNKLMSGAYKYAIGQVLSIPFSMEDQDATLSEPVNAPDVKELHAILTRVAEKADADMESITKKWRATNGDITLEQFMQLPADRIYQFVRQAAAFAGKQAG
jgi:hypothetical protein